MGILLGIFSLVAAAAATSMAVAGRPMKLGKAQRAAIVAGFAVMVIIVLTSLAPPELGRPSYSCNGSSIGLWLETAGDKALSQSPCVQAARRNMDTVGYLLTVAAAAAGLILVFLNSRTAPRKK
jgi:hypothetical protein